MKRLVTLFEHQRVPFAWTEADARRLDRLRRITGVELVRLTIHHGARKIQATENVGVIRLGSCTVQVLPKIAYDDASETTRARSATRNLLYMLEYAANFPLREHGVVKLLARNLDWFEILTRLFAAHLLEEWRRGSVRKYVAVDDELGTLKGRWRLTEQLRRPEKKHRLLVTYDEFTADNALNRVFRFVVDRLCRLTHDPGNRRMLGQLRQLMAEVTLLPSVTPAEADPARLLTRLNRRYLPLLNLARLFLDDSALQVSVGGATCFAFMFDMNHLFEAFISKYIWRHRAEVLPPDLLRCRLAPQSRKVPVYAARRDEKLVFHLRPDLVFCDAGNTFPLLVDTKYKLLDPASRRLGVAPDDFYQMFAYAHRYDCPRVVMVYPAAAGARAAPRVRFELEKTNKYIDVVTVDLNVDLAAAQGQRRLKQSLIEALQERVEP